jgi:hypothetical protein
MRFVRLQDSIQGLMLLLVMIRICECEIYRLLNTNAGLAGICTIADAGGLANPNMYVGYMPPYALRAVHSSQHLSA